MLTSFLIFTLKFSTGAVKAHVSDYIRIQSTPKLIALWQNGAPGSENRKDEPETQPHAWSIGNIYNPSITIYEPEGGNKTGTAIVIAPGGGHRELVVGEEGTKPAQMLAKAGITGIVLRYRLFREEKSGLTFEKDNRADVERAIRLVRSMSQQLGIKRVGMIGFSAGGETLSLATFSGGVGSSDAKNPVDCLNSRPDFSAWIYPGPLGIPTNMNPDELPFKLPPGFLLVAQDDGASKVCFDIAMKYRSSKSPYELHVLSGGGHGFNMGDRSGLQAVKTWFERFTAWLSDQGFLKP